MKKEFPVHISGAFKNIKINETAKRMGTFMPPILYKAHHLHRIYSALMFFVHQMLSIKCVPGSYRHDGRSPA